MTIRTLHLPPPDVYAAPDACPDCKGSGLSGRQFRLDTPAKAKVSIVVDELCDTCTGCGRNELHIGCQPYQHAVWDLTEQSEAEMKELFGPEPCPSCNGRQWIAVRTFTNDGETATYQRVPCGCADKLLMEV